MSDSLLKRRQKVREFAHQHIVPVAARLDENEEFCHDLLDKLTHFGFMSCSLDPAYGGLGWDEESYLVAIEELARVDASAAATVASHNSLALASLYAYGDEQQKQLYLPRLSKGELWGFGLTEASSGSDIQNITTTAVYHKDDDQWELNGTKAWITNCGTSRCGGATVLAKTEKDGQKGFSCFLVPTTASGFEQRPMKGKMMWRGTTTAELIFSQVRLPSSALLGTCGLGHKQMLATLDGGRLSIAAMGLGLAKGVFDHSLSYSKQRKTFSKPIIEHQAVGFKLADMYCKILAAEDLISRACRAKMSKMPFGHLAAAAKLYGSETAVFCATEGQQIWGAKGLMKDSPVERYFRDAALLRIGEGSSEIQRLVLAKYLSKEPSPVL
ncbi:MAG: acyl-CoA dehydrogenase family protein [Proteobacteria bacterium]|nr:acyl-CoA dehydrogenase family protein [Pseudomonadota bacterium]